MRTKLYFKNTSAEVVQQNPQWAAHIEGLMATLNDMPCFIWPGKSKSQPGKSVLQSLHNAYLRQTLAVRGWREEPYVVAGVKHSQRSDFELGAASARMLVEVEFGNGARTFCAFHKFLLAHSYGQLGLAVLVCPMRALAKKTDSGLTTFEAACQQAEFEPLTMMPYPLLIIGVEEDSTTTVVDWRESGFSAPTSLSGTRAKKRTMDRVVAEWLTHRDVRRIRP